MSTVNGGEGGEGRPSYITESNLSSCLYREVANSILYRCEVMRPTPILCAEEESGSVGRRSFEYRVRNTSGSRSETRKTTPRSRSIKQTRLLHHAKPDTIT